MTAPTPAVQIQGVGAVTADNYNTYTQTVINVSQLRGFIGLSNMNVFLQGTATPGDGGQGSFYWNATSTAVDNGNTIIRPNGVTVGAWIRLSTGGGGGGGTYTAGYGLALSPTNVFSLDPTITTLPAAATVDIGLYPPNIIITGNTPVTSFGNSAVPGQRALVQFTGTSFLTYNPPTLDLLNKSQNMPIGPGDVIELLCTAIGCWKVTEFRPANVFTISYNRVQNTPYAPYDFTWGAGAGTSYPDAGFMGQYSAPHFQAKSFIQATVGAGGGSNRWMWYDAGTATAPTYQTAIVAVATDLTWQLDNTGNRQADQGVAGGRSQFQGRGAQQTWYAGTPQTPTSRPGAIGWDVCPVGYQAPVERMWLDPRGGLVHQGRSVEAAIAAAVIPYPWNPATIQSSYAPVPNINPFDYVSDANHTLIVTDSSDSAVQSIYRWDKISNGTGPVGFRWGYLLGSDTLRLQAIAAGGIGTDAFDVAPTGVVSLPAGLNLSGTTLTHYDEGTWTPTIDFATHGNLSVVYTTQTGRYTRVGDVVFVEFQISFTPTFTTASGAFQLKGIPFAPANPGIEFGNIIWANNNFTFTAGSQVLLWTKSTTVLGLVQQATGSGATDITATSMATTVAQSLFGSLMYRL